ncbi:uncharacterized protein BP01DRAFT_29914 [Aspergillus saccharolyticus JOP 1030-1]|uniref:Uncharacterized protein n=1 Tax=Aspergillus saccharolyticus JOP 1030-1 TaxID=1450539 RepID=A0A318ZPI8_9EURO|nr:hypothetical protein BP01DRAFT_29914 [Aspergillus saccharolyticus JOP 1030-1]PYH46353.1 hypothetical protein BP01DRAFT_29914 [Aspergillus saccharolyticus JOP 1030-1]
MQLHTTRPTDPVKSLQYARRCKPTIITPRTKHCKRGASGQFLVVSSESSPLPLPVCRARNSPNVLGSRTIITAYCVLRHGHIRVFLVRLCLGRSPPAQLIYSLCAGSILSHSLYMYVQVHKYRLEGNKTRPICSVPKRFVFSVLLVDWLGFRKESRALICLLD